VSSAGSEIAASRLPGGVGILDTATTEGSSPSAKRWLTPAQLAERLSVTPATISRWSLQDATMPTSRLPGRVVRYEEQAINRWLARRSRGAAKQDIGSHCSLMPPPGVTGGLKRL